MVKKNKKHEAAPVKEFEDFDPDFTDSSSDPTDTEPTELSKEHAELAQERAKLDAEKAKLDEMRADFEKSKELVSSVGTTLATNPLDEVFKLKGDLEKLKGDLEKQKTELQITILGMKKQAAADAKPAKLLNPLELKLSEVYQAPVPLGLAEGDIPATAVKRRFRVDLQGTIGRNIETWFWPALDMIIRDHVVKAYRESMGILQSDHSETVSEISEFTPEPTVVVAPEENDDLDGMREEVLSGPSVLEVLSDELNSLRGFGQ